MYEYSDNVYQRYALMHMITHLSSGISKSCNKFHAPEDNVMLQVLYIAYLESLQIKNTDNDLVHLILYEAMYMLPDD